MDKWDQKYQQAQSAGEACELLANNLHLLPPQGSALDLACGLGANALLLHQQGLSVEAWDLSAVALGRLDEFSAGLISTRRIDLEVDTPPLLNFDVIVVAHYLYRPVCHWIQSALNPGGVLFFQTWHQHKRSPKGPSNPEYLLAPGELLRLFPQLEVRFYREEDRCGDLSRGQRDFAQLIAQKPAV
ncbi:class I SAM-dependent methyltransferase [Aestuariirhabdus litorea]|uniref:Methyltransferase domain-containing protein n=1 Tax=Aestuariirhabdus litorea TaxID=2528527 RepID=A0A3P3VIM3_9GAMM|nr:methyltransferase domain-containing protein [Aestuariirhabdus litorea]RRJ82585.1 methyltransferase domain-containing protein [Aestuariirhabdus litorea]RWW92744.1 methyltransferase domain-containing protein [Endozoicomonadaceae bacterium GTF-13]